MGHSNFPKRYSVFCRTGDIGAVLYGTVADSDVFFRDIYNFKPALTFSDVVRKSAEMNYLIKKYEDDLIDYGRLRNAIVHQGNHKFIIAEPHDDIVENIERLADLITEPPLAIDMVGNKEVITIPHDMKVADAIDLIYRTGYGNLPTYEGDKLIGILNARKMLTVLGEKISAGINLETFVFFF